MTVDAFLHVSARRGGQTHFDRLESPLGRHSCGHACGACMAIYRCERSPGPIGSSISRVNYHLANHAAGAAICLKSEEERNDCWCYV